MTLSIMFVFLTLILKHNTHKHKHKGFKPRYSFLLLRFWQHQGEIKPHLRPVRKPQQPLQWELRVHFLQKRRWGGSGGVGGAG